MFSRNSAMSFYSRSHGTVTAARLLLPGSVWTRRQPRACAKFTRIHIALNTRFLKEFGKSLCYSLDVKCSHRPMCVNTYLVLSHWHGFGRWWNPEKVESHRRRQVPEGWPWRLRPGLGDSLIFFWLQRSCTQPLPTSMVKGMSRSHGHAFRKKLWIVFPQTVAKISLARCLPTAMRKVNNTQCLLKDCKSQAGWKGQHSCALEVAMCEEGSKDRGDFITAIEKQKQMP